VHPATCYLRRNDGGYEGAYAQRAYGVHSLDSTLTYILKLIINPNCVLIYASGESDTP
jgi:hypothetical protein